MAVLAFAAPATAAPARGVHIVSNVTFDENGNLFVASRPFVVKEKLNF